MILQVQCDWCGKSITRTPAKVKKHNFCCRQCLSDFSNKKKNPEGYASLKDYTNMSIHCSQMNAELNPVRMNSEVREKIREARLNAGTGKTYTKRYGRHEHRIVAEEILGRHLLQGEVVHHRDGNKRNNDPRNIVIFASQSEHAKAHAEMNWFLRELEELEGGDAR